MSRQSESIPFALVPELPVRISLASALTGIPQSTLREKVRHGHIRAKRDGKLFMIRLSDLAEWHQELEDVSAVDFAEAKKQATGSRRNPSKDQERQDQIYGLRDRSKDLRCG